MDNDGTVALEQRLQAVEDRLAIYQLVCGYGYAADGLNGDAIASFYAEDGVYSLTDYGLGELKGRDAIAAIVKRPSHVGYVEGGCAHVSTLPYVVLDGDRATATCHTLAVRHGEAGFYVFRCSASRLELSRKPDGGWQIDHRQNHLLDGSRSAPALLARLQEGPRRQGAAR